MKEEPKQLTLGELRDLINEELLKDRRFGPEVPIRVLYDFVKMAPGKFNSWRGLYDEVCIGYYPVDYYKKVEPPTIEDFLTSVENAIGCEFDGYKGGSYYMEEDTPVWVGNFGDSDPVAVVGIERSVQERCTEIIIVTEFKKWHLKQGNMCGPYTYYGHDVIKDSKE